MHFVDEKYMFQYFIAYIPVHILVSNYQLNTQFLYFITKYMLHYNPRHFSSSTTLIFRRTNYIITASGIVTLCKRPYSMPVEGGALNRRTVRPFTEWQYQTL